MKNNRTFLEKLLDGAEVEWKTLDEISSIYGGLTGKGKADFENGNALYVPYKNIFNNIEVDFNNLETVNVSDDEKQYTIKYGDVLFTGSSETAEEAGMSSAVTTKTEQKIYLNSFSFGLRFNDDVELLPEFSKFLFRTLSIRKEIVKSASGVTRFNISKARFKKIKIPIPPLPVQTEIVKILDALTALTSELTSELTLRQKQYEYYREKLLSEEELGKVGFEWKPLKEIAEYIRGVTYNKTNESPNNIGYKILRANNITLSSNTLNFDDIKVIKFDTKVKSSQMLYKNDILISAASGSREHVGKVAFIYQDIDYYFGGFMGVIRCNNNVNSRYLFHIFTSSIFQDYLNEVLNSSTINNLNSKVMDSFRLPIPPLSVQTEIVKILDKFENLTNSITEGLPLAIEQSQKRYEYYRELLLSF